MFTMFTLIRDKTAALIALLAVATLITAAGTGAAQATPTASTDFVVSISADEAIAAITGEDGVLRFDVAEDATRFVWSEAPVHEDGLPAYGNAFVTQGYIYPAGTLAESNGVNADGSPEVPDQVLGQWTCRGWFVGDGAHTTTGPMVITTQLYGFGAGWGEATLVSEGYEIADPGVAVARAITGGTGPYAGARAEGNQTMLGFNATMGVNLTFEIDATS